MTSQTSQTNNISIIEEEKTAMQNSQALKSTSKGTVEKIKLKIQLNKVVP